MRTYVSFGRFYKRSVLLEDPGLSDDRLYAGDL